MGIPGTSVVSARTLAKCRLHHWMDEQLLDHAQPPTMQEALHIRIILMNNLHFTQPVQALTFEGGSVLTPHPCVQSQLPLTSILIPVICMRLSCPTS